LGEDIATLTIEAETGQVIAITDPGAEGNFKSEGE
jgi:hypothetical protein